MISIDWIEALGRWPTAATEESQELKGDVGQENSENTADGMDSHLVSLDEVPETLLGVLPGSVRQTPRGIRIENAVREGLQKLGDEERELVERYLLAGQSMTELAELTGRRLHRLTTQYQRALRKLRKHLAPLVAREFGDEIAAKGNQEELNLEALTCPICRSSHRAAIDVMISNRPAGSTWRPLIRKLRTEMGIIITTPQILIGHQRYH
jgi:hypothetical protein